MSNDIAIGLMDDFVPSLVKTLLDLRPWMKDKTFRLLTKRRDVEEYIDSLIESGLCALDLETTSLNTRTSKGTPVTKIVGVCLSGNPDEGIYIPMGHDDTEYNLPLDFMLAQLKKLCASCRCIFHNFKFDGEMLRGYGIYIEDEDMYEDTLLMAAVENASRKSKGLKELSEGLLDRPMIEIHELGISARKKNFVAFEMVPPQKAVYYGGSDGMNTFALYQYLKESMDKQDPNGNSGPWVIYKIEKRCQFVTMEMERNMVKVDLDYLKETHEMVAAKMDLMVKQIYEIVGHKFDINSPKQLGTVLFDELKIRYPEKEKTASGQYQTSESVLVKMQKDYPIVDKILAYRGLMKVQRTYIENLINNVDENKEAKFKLNQVQADTGRFSASGGKGIEEDGYCGVNCQNIPTYDPRDPNSVDLRKAIIARPGCKIVTIDYSGEELRIATNFSREPKWVQEFLHGSADLHTITAKIIYKKPVVSKQERGVGKCVAKGTLIATKTGWVPIEMLKPGDEVITHTGALRKIDNVHDMGVKMGKMIKTKSGHEITCGLNHRFLNTSDEWVRAEDLKPGDKIKTVSCENMDPDEYPRLNFNFWAKGEDNNISDALPYVESNFFWGKLLGYLMGDGHIHPNYAEVICSEDCPDVKEDIVKTVKKLGLPCSAVLKKRKDKPDHYKALWNINVGSTIFSRFCKTIGFRGRRGKISRVPDWIFRAPKTVMRGFLQAMFETDGTVDKSSVSVCTKDKQLAGDILLMLTSFGIKAYICEKPSKKYKRIYYQVQFGKLGAIEFEKKIGFIGVVKKEKLSVLTSKPHHPGTPKEQIWETEVKSVEPLDSVELYDLTVSDDHTYVAQGLVTHNTLNFLTMYGGGAEGFAQQAKIPYEIAKKMIFNFFSEYKGLKGWIAAEIKRSRKRGYSITAFGRRRSLQEFYSAPDPKIQAKGDRCAINSAIQGSGADVIKIALYRVWKWIRDNGYQDDVKILMPIHDEIVFEIKEDKLDTYIPELTEIMTLRDLTKKLNWAVPLTVDAEYGDTLHVEYDYWVERKICEMYQEGHDLPSIALENGYLNKEGKVDEKCCEKVLKVLKKLNVLDRPKELPNLSEKEENTEKRTSSELCGPPHQEEQVLESESTMDTKEFSEPSLESNVIVEGSSNVGPFISFSISVKDALNKVMDSESARKELTEPEEEEQQVEPIEGILKSRIDDKGYFVHKINSYDYITSHQFNFVFEILSIRGGDFFMGPKFKIKLVDSEGSVFKTKRKYSVDGFNALCLWLNI